MEIIYNKIFLEHETGSHPENKERLAAFDDLKETEIENGEKYLELVHPKKHISHIKTLAGSGGGFADSDTIVSRTSYTAACFAVGAC